MALVCLHFDAIMELPVLVSIASEITLAKVLVEVITHINFKFVIAIK
jgi:hypothetical protein